MRKILTITHGTKGGMAFGSGIKVLTHRTEGQNGVVSESGIFTHGRAFQTNQSRFSIHAAGGMTDLNVIQKPFPQ